MKIILTILLIFIITFITPPSFAQNRVLSLDGEGDYVEIPVTDSFALQDFTISFFVNPRAQDEDIVTLIDYGHSGYTGNWVVQTLDARDTNIWAMAYMGGVTDSWQYDTAGFVTFIEGVWQHIAFVKRGDQVLTYKDGVLVHIRTNEDTTVRYKTPAPLYFGRWGYGSPNRNSGRVFHGLLDEVRIFNYPRTQEEIKQAMHTTLSGKEPGLVGYWRFDDGKKIVTDTSPNHNDGELIGDARLVEVEFPQPGEQVISTGLSGVITDGESQPIPNASVRLEKNGKKIVQTQTNASGSYWLSISEPVNGLYNLSATKGELGGWQLDLRLREGEHRNLNLTLEKAISIEGTLLMLDGKTPHVSVPVQAILDGEVIATVLSDESGKYQFINLKPKKYQMRCQISGGYAYYNESKGAVLQVERGKQLKNIDFRFAPFKKGTWRNYTYLDGLASNGVYAIHRTPDGILWFGTTEGVSRYDGKEFVNFTTRDGLASNKVSAINSNLDGSIWFGAGERLSRRTPLDVGLSRYDGLEFANFTTKKGLASNIVNVIYCFGDSAAWFGTSDGVSCYDGESFANFTIKDGVASYMVNAIHRDSDSMLWFGTIEGVSRYDGKEFVNFTTRDGLVDNWVTAIQSAPDGVIWFGTEGGISRYDGKEFINFTTKDGLANNLVWAIQRDSDGAMWFGTEGGISRYDGKTFINFTTADGLADNQVNAIYQTPDGGLWFGTSDGVCRYDNEDFINFTTSDGLVDNLITTIHRAPDGTMWFGTKEGVSQYDGKEFINFTTRDGLASNHVLDIDSDTEGVLWLGTGHVVSRYDGKEFVTLTEKDGLAYSWLVCAIHVAADGVLWFGLADNLVSRYDGKTFTNFILAHGDPDVYAIQSTPDGIIWLGTEDGLFRYDGKEFVKFTIQNGLVHNFVNDIDYDADGNLWFGTRGGISRYDGKTFVNFTNEDGLTDNYVHALHRSSDGVLWFGTESGGVSLYDGNAWTSLDTRDGLAGNQVSSIHQDGDGSLWFGTDKGITRYRRSTSKPKVRIVSLRTDKDYMEETYKGLSQQSITPITTGSRVTIGYSAIDLKTLPEKRQYRCRIKEADKDWRSPTKSTLFDYTFNQTGAYTFEVQAIDRALNYSEPASLTLKVMPPFYLRAGFLVPTVGFGVILIAVLTIVSIGYIKRHRQVQAYQRLAVQELQEAREMQMSLMPASAPPVEGVEIAGKCLSANTVGGDFFDYLEGKLPNEIGIVIADVSGKGLKGAMNAVMTDGILHSVAKGVGTEGGQAMPLHVPEQEGQPQGLPLPAALSPAHLMSEINDTLKVKMEQYMNVTMVIAAINSNRCERSEAIPKNSVSEAEITLTLANAAHHAYPLILCNGEIQTLKSGGFPLGMRAGVQYSEEQFPLQSGDVLILMTDGIIEAKDSNEQQYSDSGRLEETISKFTQDMPAEIMVDAIINDAMAFGGDRARRDDDMTVVVAKIQ